MLRFAHIQIWLQQILLHQRTSQSVLVKTMAYATEQPNADAQMAANATEHGLISPQKWEIHVDFNNGMWWAMPHCLSDRILEQWLNGAQEVSFIWDWKNTRRGSYRGPNGEETSINRYIIDFATMQQRNLDSQSTRKVKVVCVLRTQHPL